MKMTRRLPLLCAVFWLLPLLASAADPPTFVDLKRGVRKQREAADAAAKELAAAETPVGRVLELLGDSSGAVRDRVVSELIENGSDERLEQLLPALRRSAPLVTEGLAEVFGARGFAPATEGLASLVKSAKEEESVVVALWALEQIGDASAWSAVERRHKKDKRSFRIRGDALRTLLKLDRDQAQPLVLEACQSKMLPLRIVALDLLREFDPVSAMARCAEVFTAPPKDKGGVWLPRLRLAALAVITEARVQVSSRDGLLPAVDALVARSANAEGREATELYATLRAVTGVKLAADSFTWSSWWQAQRDGWDPAAAAVTPAGKAPGETAVSVDYHGVPVDSARVAFLSDLSGGMGRTLAGEWDGPGPTRLDCAKRELGRVLGKLDDATWVQLVYFASFVHPHSGGVLPLKKARRKLIEFNKKQEIPRKPHHNRGNLYDALCFVAQRPHLDTVYLLSEGAPSEGKFQNYDRMIAHFERLNRYYRVRVHTLSVGRVNGRNRSFLEQLADGSGGRYRPVELTDDK